MSRSIGIDTSNYTTSLAVFDSDDMSVKNLRKLLPVKKGELGLRQSDAVFHHTKQMPELIKAAGKDLCMPKTIGVSVRPRSVEGSYMPCFLVGETAATAMAEVCSTPLYKTSHQTGHILSALYSAGKLDLLKSDDSFIAFHISGGTTDMLLCKPDSESVINISDIGHSLDLKAGQLVDRTGVLLGLDFPCGIQLEKLALKSDRVFKIKPSVRECCCSFSGVENKVVKMLENNEKSEDIAAFVLEYIGQALICMLNSAFSKFGRLPVVFCGGVMSDEIIKSRLCEKFDCFFATPEFSSDNAVGIAIYAAIKGGLL